MQEKQEQVNQSDINPVIQLPSKSNNFIVILLSVLLVIFVVIAGFFAFQTQKLVKELADLKTQSTLIVETTIIPTAEPAASADPTANWRKIILLNYNFKVPSNWKYLECNKSSIFVGPNIDKDSQEMCEFDGFRGLISVGRVTNLQLFKIPTNTNPDLDPYVVKKDSITIDGKLAIKQIEKVSSGMGEGQKIYVYVITPNYMDTIVFQDVTQEKLFDQILSTFKFLN